VHSWTETEFILGNVKKDVKYRSLKFVLRETKVRNLKGLGNKISVKKQYLFARSELTKESLDAELTK
jgi:hypothetical protein